MLGYDNVYSYGWQLMEMNNKFKKVPSHLVRFVKKFCSYAQCVSRAITRAAYHIPPIHSWDQENKECTKHPQVQLSIEKKARHNSREGAISQITLPTFR